MATAKPDFASWMIGMAVGMAFMVVQQTCATPDAETMAGPSEHCVTIFHEDSAHLACGPVGSDLQPIVNSIKEELKSRGRGAFYPKREWRRYDPHDRNWVLLEEGDEP